METKLHFDYSKFDFKDPTEKYAYTAEKGLSEKVVREISRDKDEPEWMLRYRLRALEHFLKRPMPAWGADLSQIDFDGIHYYVKPTDVHNASAWDLVPEQYRRTFERLGVPEAEQKFLAGVGAQYESLNVYHSLRKDLAEKGVVFSDVETALQTHPELVRKYFSTVVPIEDNKFAALNSAVWSGGSFVYIPRGVHVDLPLQAYFRINAQNVGQFERTLIIAEEGSSVHYLEGCFTKGTPIAALHGEKPIEEIREGDRVLTHKNSFRRVYWTQVRPYTGELYSIRVWGDSSQSIKVTEEHPFYAVSRTRLEYKNTAFKPRFVPARDLRKFDYLCMPIDRRVRSAEFRAFSVMFRGKPERIVLKTDADFFRLVGYYLAEGTTIGEHYLTFTFNVNESEYINDVVRLLESCFSKKPLVQSEYNEGVSLVLCSTKAARLFKSLFGNYAENKRVPGWVLLEEPMKQRELIKGYYRGDGSYTNSRFECGLKNMFRMNSVSEKLARQVRQMLLRQNIFAGLNVWRKKGNRHNSFALHVGGAFVRPFAQMLGIVSASINRGGSLQLQQVTSGRLSYAQIQGDFVYLPIRSIEREHVESLPVYNFGVKQDESYVANGFAVHNCSAPIYSGGSLHSAVVEIIAHPSAKVQYTTIQNWSNNVYNLVTKRAFAYENAEVFWLDCNIGSRVTMKFPSVYLLGENARGEILSLAYAGKGQHQDSGGKVLHYAPNSTSLITSKSVSKDGGRTSYRGLLKVAKGCAGVKAQVRCDALLLDEISRSDTYPYMEIEEEQVSVGHEATVGRIGEEQLFYLMSRGLAESEALALIVLGFIEDFTKRLPMEYAVELNRLVELDMSGSVG